MITKHKMHSLVLLGNVLASLYGMQLDAQHITLWDARSKAVPAGAAVSRHRGAEAEGN
jgi:hypothetical protein